MIKNIPESGKPKIWCPKEDYWSRDGDGISMSTTSGSSNCRNKEIEAVVYQGSRVKQQGDLFILEPSRMVIVNSKHTRISPQAPAEVVDQNTNNVNRLKKSRHVEH